MGLLNWLSKRPYTKATWIMAVATCIMAIASSVMMWTLRQNQKVIQQNAMTLQHTTESLELQRISTSNAVQQLKVEQETRLHPELECGNMLDESRSPRGGFNFALRNVGTAPATNINMRTFVICVTSNRAVHLLTNQQSRFRGIAPALSHRKTDLLPGEQANADGIFRLDAIALSEFENKFRGDVIVRIYVEYERTGTTYHRYSGHFNFLYNSYGMFRNMLETEEQRPSIQQILENYSSMPASERDEALYFIDDKTLTGTWRMMPGFGESETAIGGRERETPSNWTKHH